MHSNYKLLIIQGFRANGRLHSTRQGNFNFEIVKKGVDVGKDFIRANVDWVRRLHRILPFVGLVIGLTSFSLQTLIILFDKKRSLGTKVAASLLFVALSSLAATAFFLAQTAPFTAACLALAISVLNFLADALKFWDAIKVFRKDKKQYSLIDEEKEKLLREKQKAALLEAQQRLKNELDEHLLALLSASQEGDKKLFNSLLHKTHKILSKLVQTDEDIQGLHSPKPYLEKSIREQSQQLTISAIALTINVVSISLVIFCLATIGALPVGVSLLLCVNLLVDLAELSKNVVARCKESKIQSLRTQHRISKAHEFLNEASDRVSHDNTSYHTMLDAMPPLANVAPSPKKPSDESPKNIKNPPSKDDEMLLFQLQLR